MLNKRIVLLMMKIMPMADLNINNNNNNNNNNIIIHRSMNKHQQHSIIIILLLMFYFRHYYLSYAIILQQQQQHHQQQIDQIHWWPINMLMMTTKTTTTNETNLFYTNNSYHLNNEKINLFRPILRRLISSDNNNNNSIELIIDLKLLLNKLLPIINKVTANNQQKLSIKLTAQTNHLLSNKFHYAEQKTNYDEQDFFETIEQRFHYNKTVFNNVNELFNQILQQNNHQQNCQLFNGHTTNIFHSTIIICSNGQINGIITIENDGHILIENKRNNCNINFNNKTRTELILCEHYLNFIVGNIKTNNSIPIKRKKRSYSSERTIEISVVTGLSMYLFHKNENSLHNYVFTLISMVSHLFKHSTIGNEINIKLIKLTLFKDDEQEKNWYGSAHRTLRHFCRWQYEHNQHMVDHPLHYDTAIFLTKIDLCSKNEHLTTNNNNYDWRQTFTSQKNRLSCDTLGLAHSGQICDPETSCAIVEDNGLSAAFTIAHELGHLLGIPHDDEEQCKQFYAQQQNDNFNDYNTMTNDNKQPEFNVMVRMIDSNSHMWSWSSCSKHFITEFLDSGHGDCLLDNDSLDIRQSSSSSSSSNIDNRVRIYETLRRRSFLDRYSKLPAGALYNADEQCRLVFDRNSSICLDMPYCRKLWCTSNTVGGCRTQHMPWADGTECGNGLWCQEGKCVRIDHAALHPIDGGWSDWSPWTECSLNCNGGIRRSRRNCTNPSPQYGGKFCVGERVRYESCNLEPCQHQSMNEDSRAQQCTEFNRYNLTWVPKYDGISSSEVCALHCESNSGESHKLKSRVIDGTPCTPESFDICVNGKCLKAGCDRILGSNRRVDYCGVCGGDNSTCRLIDGQIKPRTVQHGYTFILSIPPGATNVEIIKEPSSTTSTDNNWLALRGEYGRYLLNGHFTVNVYERRWYYGGTVVEYSGIQSHGYERINITRSIQNPLHLEILCVGELHLPTISYRFAVTSNNLYINYKWIMQTEWSECNKICNGEQERKPYCVVVMRSSWMMDNSPPQINEIKVNDDYCDQHAKPATEYRVCYVDCELEWYIYYQGDCSAKCGHGFRRQQVNCTQTFINRNNERIYIDDVYCRHLGEKPSPLQNCTGNDCPVVYKWQYSEWSQCIINNNQNCGEGQQNRIAHCISMTYIDDDPSNVIHSNVAQELCQQHLADPVIVVQSCQVECPYWRIDQWSDCIGSCNDNVIRNIGEKHRTVSCIHGKQQVSDAYCEIIESKPMDRMSCELTIQCRQNSIINNQYRYENQTNQTNRKQYNNNNNNRSNDVINHQNIVKSSSSWQSGEWSSCDLLMQYVKEYHDRFTENFYNLPKCFNSMEQVAMIRKRYLELFRLNNTLYSMAYDDLAQLLRLDKNKLKRRRYVACVDQINQQVLSDNDCDLSEKPKSEEYCPIEQSLLKMMPEFNIILCQSTSTTIKTTTKSNKINQLSSNLAKQIEWRTSEWNDCYCDSKRRRFIRKRQVYCIRIADENKIHNEYCLYDHQQSKPNEIEECTIDQIRYQNVGDCDHYQSIKSTMSTMTATRSYNNQQQQPPPPSTIYNSIQSSYDYSTYSHSHHQQQTPVLFVDNNNSNDKPNLYDMDHLVNQSESNVLYTTTSNHQASILYNSSYNSSDDDGRGGWTEWFDWSDCSKQCGHGVQTREPKCTLIQCDERKRPNQQNRSCYVRNCALFQWHYSDWSECQGECGQIGYRIRTVECRDWTDIRVSDHFCENDQNNDQNDNNQRQSILKEQCHRIDNCSNTRRQFIWQTGQWSECSKSCGNGEQSRTVTCHRINKFGIVDPRPIEQFNLNKRSSSPLHISNYKKRKEKHKHKRHRIKQQREKRQQQKRKNRNDNFGINYYSYQLANDNHHWCNPMDKPKQQQSCNLGACLKNHSSFKMIDAYVWRTSKWQTCSSPCGNGYQHRKVYCYSQLNNKRVDRSYCDLRFKPEKRRQCNLRSCEIISCQDLRDRTRQRNDGIYEIWIQGTRINIYCYGMNFLEKPIEYLILNDDNYSELNYATNSDCIDHNYQQRNKQKIQFKYVRFNVLTMELIVNDTRFNQNIDIGYGQSLIQGCTLYSNHHHHQNVKCQFTINTQQQQQFKSMFSINLQKTGLIIDDINSHWIIDDGNNNLLMKNLKISPNGEKIIGYCQMKRQLPTATTTPTSILILSTNCRIGCRPINDVIRVRIP